MVYGGGLEHGWLRTRSQGDDDDDDDDNDGTPQYRAVHESDRD